MTKPKALDKARKSTPSRLESVTRPVLAIRILSRIPSVKFFPALALIAFLLSSLTPVDLTASPATPTITQILAKAYVARGGLVKLHAMQAQRVTGTISFGNDASGPFFVEMKRPLKMHMELTVQNQTMSRIFDGKDGWANNPFAGKAALDSMSDEELKNISEEADFDGPLVDYRKKGNQVTLVGKDKVGDKDAWRVKLATKTGDIRYYLIDATTYLALKWEGQRHADGKELPIQSYFSDYREVSGLKFPFRIDSGSSSEDLTQKIIVDKIEVNPQLPDSNFAKPSTQTENPTAAQ
jgi:outer membrane lipoprotein-sorting protein